MTRTGKYGLIGKGVVASVILGCSGFYFFRGGKEPALEELWIFLFFNAAPFGVMLFAFFAYEWFVAPGEWVDRELTKVRLANKVRALQGLKTEGLILTDRISHDTEPDGSAWEAYQSWQKALDSEFDVGVHDTVRTRYRQLIVAGQGPLYDKSLDLAEAFPVAGDGTPGKPRIMAFIRRRLVALDDITDKLLVRLYDD